jgi:signal transduction histidine kinase
MKLAVKLSLLFITISVLSVFILGYFSYQSSKSAVNKEVVNHLVSINILKESELRSWVDDNKNSIELLAGSSYFKQEFASMIAQHDQGNPAHLLMHETLKEDYFFPFIEKENFTELSVIRQNDGLVLISTDKKQEGKYLEDQPYFIYGKSQTYIQNVYYSMALQQPSMTIGTPLKDRAGNLIAVLAGNFDFADLSKIIGSRSGLNQSEDTYLVNKFNFFITDPMFGKGYALKKAVFSDGVKAALEHRDGFLLYNNYRGEPVIGAFCWIPESELAIITEIDQSEAYAPVFKLRNTFIFIGLGIALFSVLAGILIAFVFTRRIKRLTDGAVELGKGNLNYKFDIDRRDEVGILAEEFNRSTEKLKETLISRDELAKEISQRKLLEKELIRSNNDLESFAYIVSHDLQEPLRAISSYIQLFAKRYKGKIDSDSNEFIGFIENGALRTQNMINDLLSFSRITTKGKPFEKCKLREAADCSMSNLKLAIEDSGAQIKVGFLPEVNADFYQMIQLFQNLIGNAIKYKSKSFPRIEIKSRRENEEWLISVSDNGIGIDHQYFDRIFQIFKKLHTKDEYEGSGMGLAICKKVVERHGWRIWVESEEKKGSVFYFAIPIKESLNESLTKSGGAAANV